mgnify:FL=1
MSIMLLASNVETIYYIKNKYFLLYKRLYQNIRKRYNEVIIITY